jgi:predicted nucleic acid-binding protein
MISVDTNVFVYAVDQRDPVKQSVARSVLLALARVEAVVALQVVGEFQNALKRSLKLPAWVAAQAARNVLAQYGSFPYDREAVESALALSAAGRMSYWDALLVASADAVGVTTLLSEDMTDGLVHGGVEIVNPFGPDGPSPRLQTLLTLS